MNINLQTKAIHWALQIADFSGFVMGGKNKEEVQDEQETVNLLEKMRSSEKVYPQEMLAARRRDYLKRISNLVAGREPNVSPELSQTGGKIKPVETGRLDKK